jgi:hypothetical protein
MRTSNFAREYKRAGGGGGGGNSAAPGLDSFMNDYIPDL